MNKLFYSTKKWDSVFYGISISFSNKILLNEHYFTYNNEKKRKNSKKENWKCMMFRPFCKRKKIAENRNLIVSFSQRQNDIIIEHGRVCLL